jgi:hypothetical protein
VKLSAKVESPVGCTPCDFRRGFPLGEGFNERERAFAERIPALGEGPEYMLFRSGRLLLLCHIYKRKFINPFLAEESLHL